jgi:hypothetical protein
MKFSKSTIVGIVAILCFALVGCTTTQISTALNVASSAVNEASSAVSGWACATTSTTCPTEKAQIVASLSALATALSTAGTDLNSGSITPTQIAAITATLTQALITNLPLDIPSNVKIIMLAVVSGVDAFIVAIQVTNTSLVAKDVTKVTFKLTWEDHRKVNQSIGWLNQAKVTLATIH